MTNTAYISIDYDEFKPDTYRAVVLKVNGDTPPLVIPSKTRIPPVTRR